MHDLLRKYLIACNAFDTRENPEIVRQYYPARAKPRFLDYDLLKWDIGVPWGGEYLEES